MSVQTNVNYALKMLQYMRSGARVNSRVRVVLEWREAGSTHIVEGYTVDISPKGCLAIAPQGSLRPVLLRTIRGQSSADRR